MNGLLGIQILAVLFALFMLYITFIHQRRKEFTTKEYGFWIFAWIVFLILALFPTLLDFLSLQVLGFSRRMDFFIVLGFLFLIGLGYYTYSLVTKTQKRVEALVRKIAIDEKK